MTVSRAVGSGKTAGGWTRMHLRAAVTEKTKNGGPDASQTIPPPQSSAGKTWKQLLPDDLSTGSGAGCGPGVLRIWCLTGSSLFSPASLPGMWGAYDNRFVPFSKGMGLSGLRVGYLIACDQVMGRAIRRGRECGGALRVPPPSWARWAAFRNPGFHEHLQRKSMILEEKAAFSHPQPGARGKDGTCRNRGFLFLGGCVPAGEVSALITEYLITSALVGRQRRKKNYGARGGRTFANHSRLPMGMTPSAVETLETHSCRTDESTGK